LRPCRWTRSSHWWGKHWATRLAEIRDLAAGGPRAGQAIRQRHAIELAIEKLRRPPNAPVSVTERLLGRIAAELPAIAKSLTWIGRERLDQRLRDGVSGQNTLVGVFHLTRSAMLQRPRGFAVAF
jgi:hypothetical protein